MQTAIAPITTPGPQTPGGIPSGQAPDAAGLDQGSQDDPGREDAGRDIFASFMGKATQDSEMPADGTAPSLVAVENPLPAVMFWPLLATVSSPAADAATIAVPVLGSGQPPIAQQPMVEGLAPPPPTTLTVAAPGLEGQPILAADPRLPSGVGVPSAMPAVAPQLSDPALQLPDPPPAPAAEGDLRALSPTDAARPPMDVARPALALPGVVMALAGLRFWQAPPQQTADMRPAIDPALEAEAIATLSPPAEGERLISASAPSLPTTAPAPVLIANMAETALQSIFAAQAEAAAMAGDDLGSFGGTSSPAGAMSGNLASTVLPAPTLPTLTAQLAQIQAQRPDGMTEISLSPEELGHVRVTLQADAQSPDRIIVMLSFERPETLDLFRRHADQLADALRDAGFSGADIGFGGSEAGDQRNTRPDTPSAMLAADTGLADLPAVPAPHHPALRLAATGTLDLRL